MAQVFVSYKREDRDRVRPIVEALEAAGVTVWWDQDLKVGRPDLKTIDEELQKAKYVLVLWSQAAVKSDAVLEEAYGAKDEAKLVPAVLEEVTLPIHFRRIQTARLYNARPEANEHWPQLLAQLKGEEVMFEPDSKKAAAVRPAMIAFRKAGGPMFATGLMAMSTIAVAAPTMMETFFPQAAALTTLADTAASSASAFSGAAALLVIQQMWAKLNRG